MLIIPPNLTSLLQPLDVAINRSYQAYYRTKFDTYISQALADPLLQTPAGNPKVPRYFSVAQWILDWMASKTAADTQKAFRLCGLVAKESFAPDELHPPLKALLEPDLDVTSWLAAYRHLLAEADDREQLTIAPPAWYLPDDERSSLFHCLLHGLGTPMVDYVDILTKYMQSLSDLDGLIDSDYLEAIRQGERAPEELEIYAASKLHCWNIEVKTVDV